MVTQIVMWLWDGVTTIFGHYHYRVITGGTALIGFFCGCFGVFPYLRKQGMIGDVISHASLPGVALAFIIFQSRDSLTLSAGALVSAFTGIMLANFFTRYSRTKEDSALGLILSVFFAAGMILLVIINKTPSGNKAGINTFLFGMTATISVTNIINISLLGLVSFSAIILFWKEFTVLTFDANYSKTIALPIRLLEMVLLLLLILSIVIGLEAVGVILITSLIITPAASARQWTNNLFTMFLLAGFIGMISAVLGSLVSIFYAIPTGPCIVVAANVLFFGSFFLAPKRGLIYQYLSRLSKNKIWLQEKLLQDMHYLAENHPKTPERAHAIQALFSMNKQTSTTLIKKMMLKLKKAGHVHQRGKHHFGLIIKKSANNK